MNSRSKKDQLKLCSFDMEDDDDDGEEGDINNEDDGDHDNVVDTIGKLQNSMNMCKLSDDK